MSRKKKTNKKELKGGISEKIARTLILSILSANPEKGFNVKEVAVLTGLFREAGINKVRSILDAMCREGRASFAGGKYRLGADLEEVAGILEVTRGGLGFVKVSGRDQDIAISGRNFSKALNGDLVKVRVLKLRNKDHKASGEIVEVLERAKTDFVGTVVREIDGKFYFEPLDPTVPTFTLVKGGLKTARDGHKALARIINWDRQSPEAEIIEDLGLAGKHETEMHAILLHYGFNPKHPFEVEQSANEIPDGCTLEEIATRRDFRNITTFTIDPHDAKDFDDAISFRKLENGHYEVGVHIADVSFYVRPNTLIDKEAFKRATSVYLVDRTVPMLPERLSNNLCSLRPKEDKLTYSAVFELDENAKIHGEWYGRTVIHSDHRFTYEGAQAVLDGVEAGPFAEELQILNKMAYALRGERFATGSIDFDTNEVKFELDENDKPVRLYVKERKDAHRLIEDFMLLANKGVATFIGKKFENPPLPCIYRIHDKPAPEKLSDLEKFVEHFGIKVKLAESKNPAEALGSLITSVAGKPEANVIETMAIRSMAKAVYSTHNIGHFGLGFAYYSHFTSPIRRYPDLLLHRLLTQYLAGDYKMNAERLELESQHCSKMEKTAAEAERASIKYKQVEFMATQVGREFDGVISGMKDSGFYVEMPETLCEGMIPGWALTDDYYHYDSQRKTFVGEQHGRVFRMGDTLRVRVIKTDLQKRFIDLALVTGEEKENTKPFPKPERRRSKYKK